MRSVSVSVLKDRDQEATATRGPQIHEVCHQIGNVKLKPLTLPSKQAKRALRDLAELREGGRQKTGGIKHQR